MSATRSEIAAKGLIVPIVGHVGDGNFHLQLLVDPADADEMGRAEALDAARVDRASAVDGTCTGEHGVNIGKLAKMAKEHPTAIPYRRALEHALDPDAIVNPAKIVTVE